MTGIKSLPRQGRRVLNQLVGQTTVLLDPDSGEYYSLDEVGTRIWELCDGNRTADAIAAAICEEYEQDPAVVLTDVKELLADLASAGLLDGG